MVFVNKINGHKPKKNVPIVSLFDNYMMRCMGIYGENSTYVQSVIKTLFFNTNHRTETKLLLIIKDYCLLQFDTLKFFLGVRLYG